ncbi:hypothetical protein IV203_017803 [Nitzschia inconspicua]|uniref:Uncharacterized protein n=1 Tax=Nitzschia inconspicua TaxID=303405 RepID=A0A9K3M0M4_9STRA|nr:hypothetical protein IV203_024863 [Nitzschia inconspicua]KAG7371662.1 hypothetical protein IV203_017803 [Nitzschia inconspicua]
MKSIETSDEYKAQFKGSPLLFSYVNSEDVVKVIGDDTADNVFVFLRSHVFVRSWTTLSEVLLHRRARVGCILQTLAGKGFQLMCQVW